MTFQGWSAAAIDFYDGLEEDNSRSYWHAHKAIYETAVKRPMEELLDELAGEFGAGRIFRPHRDVRFSADKAPYKTSIAATLGERGYVQLSAGGLAAGRGMYVMAPDQLARFRQAVHDDPSGAELVERVASARRGGMEVTAHDRVRTVPRGYPKDHPRRDLLALKGLIAWQQWPVAPWLATADAKARVVAFLRHARTVDDWLEAHVGPSRDPVARRR